MATSREVPSAARRTATSTAPQLSPTQANPAVTIALNAGPSASPRTQSIYVPNDVTTSHGTSRRESRTYSEMFEEAPDCLKHQWANVFASPRAGRYSTARLHIHESSLVQRADVAPEEDVSTGGVVNERKFMFAEDLSPGLIDSLGRGLKVFPDLFEQQLYNSGYRGSYDDMDPKQWKTTHVPQQYVSLRWFSVITRSNLPDLTKWTNLYGEGKVSGTDPEGDRWELKINTPTFRPAWELMPQQGLVALEERATFSHRSNGPVPHGKYMCSSLYTDLKQRLISLYSSPPAGPPA